jgi:hypothetical protein
MRNSRKLFRLFKWVVEIHKIKGLVENPPGDIDEIGLLLSKKPTIE